MERHYFLKNFYNVGDTSGTSENILSVSTVTDSSGNIVTGMR